MLDKETKELLPDTIKNAMEAVRIQTHATDEITLPVALAVASFATQAHANGDPLAWSECPLGNYFVVLTPSGGLKTSISSLFFEGVHRFEESQKPIAADAATEYEIKKKKYDKYIRDQSNKGDAIVVPNTPITPFEKVVQPEPPRGWQYTTQKCTLNGLLSLTKRVQHFAIFNSDAGEFFNSHAFQREESALEFISVLSRIWSGEIVSKLTGMENSQNVNKRGTILFMLQQELANFFVNPRFKDQGFTHRILITQSEKVEKRKITLEDIGVSRRKDVDIQLFNDRVYELLKQVDVKQQQLRQLTKMQMKLQDISASPNTLALSKFPLSNTDNTKQIFIDVYNDMIDRSNDPMYKQFQLFMHRAYEHFVRLATTLAIFDGKDMVGEREALCARGLLHYFIDQRLNLNIDGEIKIDYIVEVAEILGEWLRRKYSGKEITKSILNDYAPQSYKKLKTADRDKVLEELCSRDIITTEKSGKRVTCKVK